MIGVEVTPIFLIASIMSFVVALALDNNEGI